MAPRTRPPAVAIVIWIALTALAGWFSPGRSIATPARALGERALNALVPEQVRARVGRVWKGIGRGQR